MLFLREYLGSEKSFLPTNVPLGRPFRGTSGKMPQHLSKGLFNPGFDPANGQLRPSNPETVGFPTSGVHGRFNQNDGESGRGCIAGLGDINVEQQVLLDLFKLRTGMLGTIS